MLSVFVRNISKLLDMNIISIDLGTTNTQIAYLNEQGNPSIVQIGGQDSIPSLLFYDERQDKLLVGKQARNAYARLRLRDARVAEQRLLCGEQFKPRLCERAVKADSCCFAPVRGREISWLEVVKAFFSFCKREAERCVFDGETVQGVRLTHPAEFSSLSLYEIAAKAVGFNSIEFVPEPEAAYLACESIHKLNTVVLVFDMGGGTLDIVCAEKQKSGQVHLSGEKRMTLRNVNVGGEYIDRALCNELLPQLRELPGVENYQPDDDFRRWVQESVKEYLGEGWYEDCEATYYIEQLGILARFCTVYSYDKLVKLVNREYQPIFHDLEHYIEQRHESERPSMVLMVGGSSRLKPIQEQLRKLFPGRDNVLVPNDGGSLVVKGALLKSVAAENEHSGNDSARRRVIARCKTLRIENKQLKNEIEDLNKRIEILLSRISAYGISIGELTNGKEQLLREIKRLGDECSGLRAKNNQLLKEKATLQKESELQKNNTKILLKKYSSLHNSEKCLRNDRTVLQKEKETLTGRCTALENSNAHLKEQIKSVIHEKNAEVKEKLKWQSRCADYLRSDEALRKEKATLQEECISLQSKLDDERSTGWLWKAGLSLLAGLVLGCLYTAFFHEQPVETQQQSMPITGRSSVSTQNIESARTKQPTVKTSGSSAKDKATQKPDELEELRKAAAQGNKIAQYNMGWHYATGKGVKQNWEMAVKWYKLAAEQGQPDAQYHLGECYELGNGVQKDFEIADKWYKKAAAGGQAQAKKIMSQAPVVSSQDRNDASSLVYIGDSPTWNKTKSEEQAKRHLEELGVKSTDYTREIFKIFKEEKSENQEILTKLELLIQAGGSVNSVDKAPGGTGMTPLGIAAYKGWMKCLKVLLKQPQIMVNMKDSIHKATPLFWAVRGGNTDCVAALLASPDIKINEANAKGWTPLLYAVYNNDRKCLEILLSRKDLDVNIKEKEFGMTPLHCAAERGLKGCIQMLIKHPQINLNATDKNGKTPRELATDIECKNMLCE